jgi:tetratricopeptide (TPR) repeat protein
VIVECTVEIDKPAKTGAQPSYDVYMHRGHARCFVPSKDGNYEKAIEDLSMAVTLVPDDKKKVECLFKRAYAYWISGRYDCAIADCKEIIKAKKVICKAIYIKKFAHELLGNIYSALDNPLEALEQYKEALSKTPGSLDSPSLLDKYREACEKLNRRR